MPDKILIIEDYADNRELFRLMLEQAGYVVREASNGRDGVDVAVREQPDAMLIDLSMPGTDGWDVLTELRADLRTANIPCAAVSAFADGARGRALAFGFNAYLTKPFRREELLQTVEHLLSEKRAKIEQGKGNRQEKVL
ncbi:MAG: response regulator [Acidobacteria bacterium]|nr:MAG: response regulator [Acidobacteriota bacterium]